MTAADAKRFAGAYVTLTVVLTAFWLVLDARAAERTGLHRQVFPDVGFRDAPLLHDISSDVTLDFLDGDPALPSSFLARAGKDSGTCPTRPTWSYTVRATTASISGSMMSL